MTIPIRPGPFSFLAQLGQAGGEAFKAAHEQEDKLKKEAQNRLNMMLTLRSKGLIKPDAFHSPEAMQLYKRLGIEPVSDQPNFEDMANFAKAQFGRENAPAVPVNVASQVLQGVGSALVPPAVIPAQGPDAVSDARRAVYGLPSRSAVAIEGRKADIATSGTDLQKDQLAGVSDPLTLQTQVETQRDTLYNALAIRSVSAVIGPTGKDILDLNAKTVAEDAWKLAEQDAKSKGYTIDKELTRPYIDAAILAAQQEARKLQIARIAAQNAGRGANENIALLKILQDQQSRINDSMRTLALDKPNLLEGAIARQAAAKIAEGKTPEQMQDIYSKLPQQYREAYDKARLYERTSASLRDEANGVRDQLQNMLPGGGATPSRGPTSMTPAQIKQSVDLLNAKKGTLQQLEELVKAGKVTQADYNVIRRQALLGGKQ